MPAPAALERLKAETVRRLQRYRIERIGCRYVVIRSMSWNRDHDERTCPSQDAAEQYLFDKLPAIESEV